MGVETQSETVWMQANKFGVPRIAFVNKLDRLGTTVDITTKSVRKRLKVEPILINIPTAEGSFKGLIDLPSMTHIDYSGDEMGNYVDLEPVDKGHALFEMAIQARETMVDQLSNFDEELGDLYLSEDIENIPMESIDQAVRKAILSGKAVPLLCGSALKNKGVQPLMDAIVKYLPDPA